MRIISKSPKFPKIALGTGLALLLAVPTLGTLALPDDPTPPVVTINNDARYTWAASVNGGTTTVRVTAKAGTTSVAWSAASDEAWLTPTVASQTSLRLTAIANYESTQPRTANVTVTAGEVTKEFAVTQAAPTVTLRSANWSGTTDQPPAWNPAPSSTATTLAVIVSTNVTTWTAEPVISAGSNWLSLDKTSGSTGNTARITVAPEDDQLRIGQIDFKVGQIVCTTLRVYQAGNGDNSWISLSTDEALLAPDNDATLTTPITVNTNQLTWHAEVAPANGAWLRVTEEWGDALAGRTSFNVVARYNPTQQPRIGYVSVTSDNGSSTTLKVTQQPAAVSHTDLAARGHVGTISNSAVTVPRVDSYGGITFVQALITATAPWHVEVENNVSWLFDGIFSGQAGVTYYFNIGVRENFGAPRSANVSICLDSYDDQVGECFWTFTIKQEGINLKLTSNPSTTTFAATDVGQVISVTLSGAHPDRGWQVNTNATWLTAEPGSGNDTSGTFDLSIQPNTGAARDTTVEVISGTAVKTFVVKQKANTWKLSEANQTVENTGITDVSVTVTADVLPVFEVDAVVTDTKPDGSDSYEAADWLTITPLSDDSFTFTVQPNYGKQRIAWVRVQGGPTVLAFKVTQKTAILKASATTWTVAKTATPIKDFTITQTPSAGQLWVAHVLGGDGRVCAALGQATCPEIDWLTVNPDANITHEANGHNGEPLSLHVVSANTTGQDRVAQVRLVPDLWDASSPTALAPIIITITQKG
ncbi:MAG: hypothetical protein LBG70_00365 [Bifidobacteriaceae bacterium]|jgi:hypothetical protein|nr:hypothetical protein [Bifidobacteriaceae bacterium]